MKPVAAPPDPAIPAFASTLPPKPEAADPPAATSGDNPQRRYLPLMLGGATLLAIGVTGLIAPDDNGIPLCPSKFMFGIDCPLCGSTRAVGALARGHVGNALDHNVVLIALVPLFLVWWAMWAVRSWNGRTGPRPPWNRAATITVTVFLAAFLVLRNFDATPWMHWLGADLA